MYIYMPVCTRVCVCMRKYSMVSIFDWCCFCYSRRHSLDALIDVSSIFSNIYSYTFVFFYMHKFCIRTLFTHTHAHAHMHTHTNTHAHTRTHLNADIDTGTDNIALSRYHTHTHPMVLNYLHTCTHTCTLARKHVQSVACIPRVLINSDWHSLTRNTGVYTTTQNMLRIATLKYQWGLQ